MSEPVTVEEGGLEWPRMPGYELAHEWEAKCKAAESDRDAGWAAAEKLCESLREIAKGFDDDGYLYNRDEVLKVVAWFDAARAKRNPNSEI